MCRLQWALQLRIFKSNIMLTVGIGVVVIKFEIRNSKIMTRFIKHFYPNHILLKNNILCSASKWRAAITKVVKFVKAQLKATTPSHDYNQISQPNPLLFSHLYRTAAKVKFGAPVICKIIWHEWTELWTMFRKIACSILNRRFPAINIVSFVCVSVVFFEWLWRPSVLLWRKQ